MENHPTSKYNKKVRAALSKKTLGCHIISLAGHVEWEINEGKKFGVIYYSKRKN